MTDLERFEGRLAASLLQLADEAPVEVDAVQLTERAASGTRALDRLGIGSPWRLPPALRLPLLAAAQAAVIVALLIALIAIVALGQRMTRSPYEGVLTGGMACSGQAWTSRNPATVVLDCSMEVQDARLAGAARLEIGAPTAQIALERRHAIVELVAADAIWRGDLELMVSVNGTTAGDMVLIGRGAADGLIARLHLVSADGVTWGVVGEMSSSP
jgi:hypothetical protein